MARRCVAAKVVLFLMLSLSGCDGQVPSDEALPTAGFDFLDDGDAAVCSPDRVLCGDRCVEIRSDPDHCGGCGQSCTTAPNVASVGSRCVNGTCALVCLPDFGDCEAAPGCETDLSTNDEHCGACENRCDADEGCAAGRCLCGTSKCTDDEFCCPTSGVPRCVSKTDPAHCGACGFACAQEEVCQEGRCICPFTLCDGLCTNTAVEVENCGTCGHQCASDPNTAPTGHQCIDGVCNYRCDNDWADCEVGEPGCERYVNTESDCGACGVVCENGTYCLGEQCLSAYCESYTLIADVHSLIPFSSFGMAPSGQLEPAQTVTCRVTQNTSLWSNDLAFPEVFFMSGDVLTRIPTDGTPTQCVAGRTGSYVLLVSDVWPQDNSGQVVIDVDGVIHTIEATEALWVPEGLPLEFHHTFPQGGQSWFKIMKNTSDDGTGHSFQTVYRFSNDQVLEVTDGQGFVTGTQRERFVIFMLDDDPSDNTGIIEIKLCNP